MPPSTSAEMPSGMRKSEINSTSMWTCLSATGHTSSAVLLHVLTSEHSPVTTPSRQRSSSHMAPCTSGNVNSPEAGSLAKISPAEVAPEVSMKSKIAPSCGTSSLSLPNVSRLAPSGALEQAEMPLRCESRGLASSPDLVHASTGQPARPSEVGNQGESGVGAARPAGPALSSPSSSACRRQTRRPATRRSAGNSRSDQ